MILWIFNDFPVFHTFFYQKVLRNTTKNCRQSKHLQAACRGTFRCSVTFRASPGSVTWAIRWRLGNWYYLQELDQSYSIQMNANDNLKIKSPCYWHLYSSHFFSFDTRQNGPIFVGSEVLGSTAPPPCPSRPHGQFARPPSRALENGEWNGDERGVLAPDQALSPRFIRVMLMVTATALAVFKTSVQKWWFNTSHLYIHVYSHNFRYDIFSKFLIYDSDNLRVEIKTWWQFQFPTRRSCTIWCEKSSFTVVLRCRFRRIDWQS